MQNRQNRGKPQRSNGIKPYVYPIKDFPKPEFEGLDGIYRRVSDSKSVTPADYVSDAGNTLDDVFKHIGAKDFVGHKYQSLDTFLNAMNRKLTTLSSTHPLTKVQYLNQFDCFTYVEHGGWDVHSELRKELETPGIGHGIALAYDPKTVGMGEITKVKSRKDLPEHILSCEEYRGRFGDEYSHRYDRITVPSDKRLYHITFKPESREVDLGVMTESYAIHNGILEDNHINSGGNFSRETAVGRYELTEVKWPKKVVRDKEGNIVSPKGFRDLQNWRGMTWEKYDKMMESNGEKHSESYHGKWSTETWRDKTPKVTDDTLRVDLVSQQKSRNTKSSSRKPVKNTKKRNYGTNKRNRK